MPLISRLIRILRASLAGNVATGARPGATRGERKRRTGGHQRRQSPGMSPQPRPDYDPVLAGYYENLEVPYGSDLETVRHAWKNLLRKYHPDLHSNDPEKRRIATELTQGLNRAFEELERRLLEEGG